MEKVRKLDFKDLEQIVKLRLKIQNYDLKYVSEESILLSEEELLVRTRDYLEKHLNKDIFLFGYFIGEKLVANCGCYIEEHFPTFSNPSGLTGYICNVFTLEEYRGKGFQKKIFEECFNFAKEQGIIRFELSSRNEKAIKMYEAFGFSLSEHTYTWKTENIKK